MRIAILYSGFISRASGTDERVFQIAHELANHGNQVTLSGYIPNESKSDLTNVELLGYQISISFRLFVWLAQLIKSCLMHKYDIIQIECFSSIRTLPLFLVIRHFCKKTVIVFHDKYFKTDPRGSISGKFNLFLQRVLLNLFDMSITPGLIVKQWFEELHGPLVTEKMKIIPNGVTDYNLKDNVDCSHLRKKYALQGSFVCLFFGSMVFKPNYESALHLHDLSDFVATEFEKRVKKKLIFAVAGICSENLPKTKNFVPIGFIDEFDELMALPHVIILPHTASYSGPHIKTIYALRSKKPVIATKDAVKDMPDIIPNQHYIPFEVNDPASLLDALVNVYNDKKLQKNLAISAYDYTQNFSWKHISQLHIKLYEHMLER